jgi:hypothetical protein
MNTSMAALLPRPQPRRRALWGTDALIRLLLADGLALGLLAAGWYGTHQRHEVAGQISWINLAAAGVLVAGAGNFRWLLRGRQAVGERRVALLEVPAPGSEPGTSSRAVDASDRVVRVEGGVLLHRPGCEIVAGKATVAAASNDRARRCAICRP